MKNNPVKVLEKEISNISRKFENDEKIKEYEETLDSFKKLVKIGIVKERGNKLLSITEQTNKPVVFNV
ncbi:hypothetical protein EH153_01295 [Elizabethkingia anophelis]|uniref:hypothetical protein n=1 Tax=Elizabethkingia anophelis TaxID=1117645 RepID=UPI00136F3502|nr:hypothetical protein [Elizabethkingia anophelis]MYY46612.1 hypothetical protein [Elizabethkingia anophelis]